MKALIYITPILFLSSCQFLGIGTTPTPTPTPGTGSGNIITTETGSTTLPNEFVASGSVELSDPEIIALVEAELQKDASLSGSWEVTLTDTTLLESITDDGRSYEIYEGGYSSKDCLSSPASPCEAPRFFLVTTGGDSLYFESSSGEYSCPSIGRSLTGEILDFTKELFCTE